MGFQLNQLSTPSLEPWGEKDNQNQFTAGNESRKESKQMPAGKGRTLTSNGIRRSPPRARSPSLRSAVPRIPRLWPAPRLRRSAPSARPGPAVAAAECHGAIALPPPLCTMSERSASPEVAGAEAFSGKREGEGRPAQRKGARRAERRREVARTVCGRGGEPHSGSRRLLPAPASTFCTAQRGTCPQPLGSCDGLHTGGRTAELGASSPKQPALHGTEANLAARPAPQPFSRGSGRGCRGGSRTCYSCSTTYWPLPRRSTHYLPSTSFPTSKAADCTGTPGRSSSCYCRLVHSVSPTSLLPTYQLWVKCALSAPEASAPLTTVGPRLGSTTPDRGGNSCARFPTRPIYCHNLPNNKLLSRLASTRTLIGCS
ncbi:uncharacterized protein LOC118992507 [Sturnira hondurensis]|uniref:uncharacterized protein LOC118992507 n=1 Tax=Sturnira hondurensis TaxID=192404 RepID=UPI00187A1FBA|nr:uncharacterized protein LOC118992507 [Sturnira hondurensis]